MIKKHKGKAKFKEERLKRDRRQVWMVALLIAVGFIALIYFFSWFFTPERLSSAWLVAIMVIAVICATPQLVGNWLLYLRVPPLRRLPGATQNLRTDVFITAYDEEIELVRKALTAASQIRGCLKIWLLDDGERPALKDLAVQYSVGYLTRAEHKDAKAGNINAALKHTEGDIIAIFDIDHLPAPDFLERTVPHFQTGDNGFIQVMLTFSNGAQSWIARAANESSLDYYNPTCRGCDGLNGATLTGSNALIRREALEDIGGYRPGLAEDLATSITLHAAGWRSVYVPEPLAPGLAPYDLGSWFIQQMKWARGVFELLLTVYPRLFFHLTKGQKLIYAIRMTYYWIGPVIMAHILITIVVLFSGDFFLYQEFTSYLFHLIPLALIAMIIRQAALFAYKLPDTRSDNILWRASALVFSTWPVYTFAWIMAMFGIPLKFRSTPKTDQNQISFLWLAPQMMTVLMLLGGCVFALVTDVSNSIMPALFAIVLALAQIPLLLFSRTDPDRARPVEANTSKSGQSFS